MQAEPVPAETAETNSTGATSAGGVLVDGSNEIPVFAADDRARAGALAVTGAPLAAVAMFGLLLVALGGALVRRRRRHG